ncbi:MAG: hypothetical protein L6R40_008770 [Gallowayella cf. fulva]|nr:MAG: hypothetical protein L6R40_008770 [Xanthomendoza cf. fulva]
MSSITAFLQQDAIETQVHWHKRKRDLSMVAEPEYATPKTGKPILRANPEYAAGQAPTLERVVTELRRVNSAPVQSGEEQERRKANEKVKDLRDYTILGAFLGAVIYIGIIERRRRQAISYIRDYFHTSAARLSAERGEQACGTREETGGRWEGTGGS